MFMKTKTSASKFLMQANKKNMNKKEAKESKAVEKKETKK